MLPMLPMLHYLIKITDNTLCVVIVLSLLCALAAPASRKEKRFISGGIAFGFMAALVYAILKRNTGIAVREYYDLGVMLPSLFLSLLMFAMWPSFKGSDDATREKGARGLIVLVALLATQVAYFLPNLMLYPFEFAVGMESVFNTEFLGRVMAYALGLLLMWLLGRGLFRMAARLPRAFLRALLLAALLILFAKFSIEVAQILLARNWVPRSPWLMSALIFVLTHVNGFAFAMMGIASLLSGWLIWRIGHESIQGSNPALRRKQKAERRRLYAHTACVLVCLLVSALTITTIRAWASEEEELSPALEMTSAEGALQIPIETINDGHLHRFQYLTPQGTAVRFIVIRKSESAYGVGLDACDICGPSGYYQRKKGQIVCKLCDVVINISTIGFPGGCNPVPLHFSIAQGHMRILAKDLEAEQGRFQGHAQDYGYTPLPKNADSRLAVLMTEWGMNGMAHAASAEHCHAGKQGILAGRIARATPVEKAEQGEHREKHKNG